MERDERLEALDKVLRDLELLGLLRIEGGEVVIPEEAVRRWELGVKAYVQFHRDKGLMSKLLENVAREAREVVVGAVVSGLLAELANKRMEIGMSEPLAFEVRYVEALTAVVRATMKENPPIKLRLLGALLHEIGVHL